MKRILTLIVAVGLFLSVSAEDRERLTVTIGGVKTLDLPFVFESYRSTSRERITIEEASEKQLRIIGKSVGECNLEVRGGGVVKVYSVTVASDIGNVLKKLRVDLDTVPELDLSINQDHIIVRGTVSDPKNWKVLQQVLPHYKDKVRSFAEFRPAAETLLNLKKTITDAGFVFCAEGATPEPGQLSMTVSADSVIVAGELFSEQDQAKIMQILGSQSWLDFTGKADVASEGKIKAIINLNVIETMLQVDIVYVGISRNNMDAVGSSAPTLGANFSTVLDLVRGTRTSDNPVLSANMDQTLQFLAANGVTRTYRAGHVSFLNNDGKGGMLRTGGTIKAKVAGVETGSIQNINYGLTINVKGGLVSESRVKLDISLDNTTYDGKDSDSYTLSTDSTSQTVICPMDKTIVLGGMKDIMQNTSRSGLPVFRNTPVLQWFCSQDVDSSKDVSLLVLACPRRVQYNPDTEISIPLDQQTAPTYRDAKRDNTVRIEEEKRHRGWLSWLNWFSW